MKITRTSGLGGFTLVELMIVVAIIGILAAIALPSILHARTQSQAAACINNLREIESACQQFAMVANKKYGDIITYPDDLTPYIKLTPENVLPSCPVGGKYTLLPVGQSPDAVCSLGTTVSPPHVAP